VIYDIRRSFPDMKRPLLFLALCAIVALPVAAFGQAGPPPGVQGASPSPEQRAAMEKARADAKVAAYAALTPAHRDRVTAIIADVAAGKTAPRDAAKLIDDVLTPDEQKAVRDVAQASRRAMRGGATGGPPAGSPGGPPPGPPGGPPPGSAGSAAQAGGSPPPQGRRFSPSAGRFLIMVSLTRGQLRSLEPRARSSAAP
jgi:hypothetical protein